MGQSPGAVARRATRSTGSRSRASRQPRLLKTIVAHPDFREGRLDTRWLETVLLPSFTARKDC